MEGYGSSFTGAFDRLAQAVLEVPMEEYKEVEGVGSTAAAEIARGPDWREPAGVPKCFRKMGTMRRLSPI